MSTTSTPERKIHQGHNIKRYREILGIKQEALAYDMGDNWSQKKISILESKEEIDPAILEQVSKILNIPMEKLESQDAEQSMVNIQNNYENSNNSGAVSNAANSVNATITFNPIEKLMEAFEEIKRLNEEHKTLYERMLKEKDEEIARLHGKK